MKRLEIMTKISLLLKQCEENECKSNCEHAPELRQYGEMLEQDTRLARLKKYNGKVMVYDSIENQRFDKDEILGMIEEGYVNKEIIDYYQTTEPIYYSYISKHKIVNPNVVSKSFLIETQRKLEQIQKYFEEGLINKTIYMRMGIKKDTYYAFLRTHNLTNPNKDRPGRKLF